MKHIFWIACGVLAVAVLAGWYLAVPSDEARDSKRKLDSALTKLQQLEARADKGTPNGVFDAANPAHTKQLAEEYLIAEQWKGVLQPHVEKYEKQVQEIKTLLAGRGEYLRVPVAPTRNVLEWYSAYVAASESLIAKLREAGCMARAAADEERSAGGESPAAIRGNIGLYTKSGSFPEPREHPLLTTRLRALELLSERLIAARIAIADSPVVGATGRSEDRTLAATLLSQVEWVGGGEDGMQDVQTPVAGQMQARSVSARLTLDGPLSALLAASAAFERNDNAKQPVVAVTGAQLSRRTSSSPGDRIDQPDDRSRLVLSVSVIEFIDTAAPAGAN